MKTRKSPRKPKALLLKEKEAAWNTQGNEFAALPTYNPLGDKNLRSHFENKRIRRTLYEAGLIDKEGRILEAERNKGKLFIIEQEFAQAEREVAILLASPTPSPSVPILNAIV